MCEWLSVAEREAAQPKMGATECQIRLNAMCCGCAQMIGRLAEAADAARQEADAARAEVARLRAAAPDPRDPPQAQVAELQRKLRACEVCVIGSLQGVWPARCYSKPARCYRKPARWLACECVWGV